MYNPFKTDVDMKMTCRFTHRIICLLAVLALLPSMLCAQKLHRYVVEVETVPVEREYEVRKLANGNYKVEDRTPVRTVRYYEIISPTPLTTQQCDALIRQGKARLISNFKRSKYDEMDLWSRPNMTMDGDGDINPWDIDPTEYDLKYEDPDLYEFIAD